MNDLGNPTFAYQPFQLLDLDFGAGSEGIFNSFQADSLPLMSESQQFSFPVYPHGAMNLEPIHRTMS